MLFASTVTGDTDVPITRSVQHHFAFGGKSCAELISTSYLAAPGIWSHENCGSKTRASGSRSVTRVAVAVGHVQVNEATDPANTSERTPL